MKKLLQSSFIMQFIAFSAIMQDRTCAEIIDRDDGPPIPDERVKINLQLVEPRQL